MHDVNKWRVYVLICKEQIEKDGKQARQGHKRTVDIF